MKNATYGEENDGTLQFCLLSVAKIMQRCMNTQQHRLTIDHFRIAGTGTRSAAA
jgi:hypothetical protein